MSTRTPPPDPAPDRPLGKLLLAARRDPAALDALLARVRTILLKAAPTAGPPGFRSSYGDSDLAQETLLLAVQHFQDFRGTTGPQFVRWVRAILESVALMHARRANRAGDSEHAGAARWGAAGTPDPDVPDPRLLPPDEVVAHREQLQVARDALATLPEHYRIALRLKYEERCSYEEIGRKMVARALQEVGGQLGARR